MPVLLDIPDCVPFARKFTEEEEAVDLFITTRRGKVGGGSKSEESTNKVTFKWHITEKNRRKDV